MVMSHAMAASHVAIRGPASASAALPIRSFLRPGRAFSSRRPRLAVRAAAQESEFGVTEKAAVGLGLLANPLVLYSDYVLKTTGRGLPEGPGGLYGAAEGVAYLVVVGIIGWSIATKVRTGSGLPAGPAGLLGAVEGFSYLTLVASIAAFTLTFLEKGSLPGVTG